MKEVESREKLGSFALSSSDKSVPNFKLDKIQDGSTKSEVEADTEPYIDPLPHVTITTEESKNAHTSKDLVYSYVYHVTFLERFTSGPVPCIPSTRKGTQSWRDKETRPTQ